MPADHESLRVFQRLVKAVCNICVTHFSRYDAHSGINTSLTFTCPHDITTDTLAYMSSRAAAAFGYMEQNIDACFHYSDDIFGEFDEEDDEEH